MKLLIYNIITQIIIILGKVRQMVERKLQMQVIKQRTFVFDASCLIGCCDCGLEHLCWSSPDGLAQLSQPLRPKNYDYRFRKLADTPSGFISQDKLYEPWQDKWRVKKK